MLAVGMKNQSPFCLLILLLMFPAFSLFFFFLSRTRNKCESQRGFFSNRIFSSTDFVYAECVRLDYPRETDFVYSAKSASNLRGANMVNTIPADSTLMRCFAIMSRLGVSGLGVTEPRTSDQGGEWKRTVTGPASKPPGPEPVLTPLIGSVSESDLRRITRENLDVLAMSVGEFISKLHATAGDAPMLTPEPMAAARAHPLFSGMLTEGELEGGRLNVTCAPDASLFDVMFALARNRIHRVYAIDPSTGAAVRVVTHSDLIRFFAMFAPAEEGDEKSGLEEDEKETKE